MRACTTCGYLRRPIFSMEKRISRMFNCRRGPTGIQSGELASATASPLHSGPATLNLPDPSSRARVYFPPPPHAPPRISPARISLSFSVSPQRYQLIWPSDPAHAESARPAHVGISRAKLRFLLYELNFPPSFLVFSFRDAMRTRTCRLLELTSRPAPLLLRVCIDYHNYPPD